MAMQTILADKTVSASELRKSPCQFFTDKPVAVLSHSKTAGYMVGAELFEKMVALIEEAYPEVSSAFRPASARLDAIAYQCTELLLSASDNDLDDFEE